ncbi:hypothetical protein [Clostridium sp.]|uniref:hypothetical protein n=1 Tax=Clostridium sp. TaxID=1506 RepID=UPI003464CFD1
MNKNMHATLTLGLVVVLIGGSIVYALNKNHKTKEVKNTQVTQSEIKEEKTYTEEEKLEREAEAYLKAWKEKDYKKMSDMYIEEEKSGYNESYIKALYEDKILEEYEVMTSIKPSEDIETITFKVKYNEKGAITVNAIDIDINKNTLKIDPKKAINERSVH